MIWKKVQEIKGLSEEEIKIVNDFWVDTTLLDRLSSMDARICARAIKITTTCYLFGIKISSKTTINLW